MKEKEFIRLSITPDMDEKEVEMFRSMKGIRGLTKEIMAIILAFKQMCHYDGDDIHGLYGMAMYQILKKEGGAGNEENV